MIYRNLGNTDVKVSVACLGTMTFGEQNTEEEAFEQLDYFMSVGGNFVDTAEIYPVPPRKETCGKTEEIIGRWMKSRGNRNQVFLATKVMGGGGDGRNFVVGNRSVPRDQNPPAARLSRDQIHQAVNASLRRLQTDYIDLIQLHWPDRKMPKWGRNQYQIEEEDEAISFAEQVTAVHELISQGIVRHWGLSNETSYGVCKMVEAATSLGVPLPVTIQNDYSFLDRRFDGELAEACSYSKIGLLVYGGLAGGSLTDKYHDGSIVSSHARHRLFPGFQQRYHSERSMQAARKYYEIAKSRQMSLASMSLAWCKSRWFVTSVIIGATTMEQLKENLAAFDIDCDDGLKKEIDQVHVQFRNPNVQD